MSRKAKHSRKRDDPLTDWLVADELPRAGLADAHKFARRARTYRVVVWASVFLLPLALLALFTTAAAPEPEIPSSDLDSPGKIVATQGVSDWLASTPEPLPGGVVLSWDGFSDEGLDTGVGDQGEGRRLEVHYFSVADGHGNTYKVDIQVAVDPRGGAVVIAGPSLIPVPEPAGDDWQSGSTWPGYSKANTTDNTAQAVQAWANAFVSGDPNSLRLAVGDPDNDAYYAPLVGVVAAESKIVDAAHRSDSTMIVRATLEIQWLGQPERNAPPTAPPPPPPAPKPDETPEEKFLRELAEHEQATAPPTAPANTGTPTVVTFDLLVERAQTASPVVTAWGGPGTGPDLERYSNAVDGQRSLPTVTTTTAPPPGVPG